MQRKAPSLIFFELRFEIFEKYTPRLFCVFYYVHLLSQAKVLCLLRLLIVYSCEVVRISKDSPTGVLNQISVAFPN